MKLFYVIALVIVGVLVAAPFYLLPRERDDNTAGKVVGYNTYGSKVKSIDPATCGDTTSSGFQGGVYEGLYTYHYLKRPVEVIPQLAAAMPEISEDGRTYTIHLRPGVRYSRNPCFGVDAKGRPKTRTVRAEDFVLAFKRVADYHLTTSLSLAFISDRIEGLKEYRERTRTYHKGDFSRYEKEDLPGVRAVDELTLQFRLVEPFPQFVYVLAMHVYAPIPHEVIDYHLAGGANPIPLNMRNAEILRPEAVVGTGPYLLDQWARAHRIVLTRNPDYRGDIYPTEGGPGDEAAGLLHDAGKPVPFVDQWDYTFVQEENPAWMMFERKQRDMAGIPRDAYANVISQDKELLDKWAQQGVRLRKGTSPAIFWLAFNMDDRVLGNSKSLRQALCLAFNVEEYIEVIFNGRASRAVNTIPSSFKGHAEAGPSPYARFDVAAAKAKIAEARRELVAAGVIAPGKDIPTLTVDMPGTGEHFRRVGELAQRYFRQIGVTVKVEMNDWPTLQQKVHNKQCQIYAMGWQADYPDAENFLQLYYSPNIQRGTNNTNYRDKRFDELFAKAAVMMDESKRVPLYAEMTKILNEDCPVLLLTEPIYYTLYYQWVYNLKSHPVGYGYRKYIRIDAAQRRRLGGR